MESQMRNLFADLHEIPDLDSTLSEMAAVGQVSEDLQPKQAEECADGSKNSNSSSADEALANNENSEDYEAAPLTPGGSTGSEGDADGSSNDSKSQKRRKSSDQSDKTDQEVRRSSRHDKEIQMYTERRKSSEKASELNETNIIPNLRRSSRRNKGVSKEVFDPSHIPKSKPGALAASNQASPSKNSRSDSTDGEGSKKRKISDDKTKTKKDEKSKQEKEVKEEQEEEDKGENEESDSDSDDGYNDPNRPWCICKKPYDGRFMISCDVCEEWYHGDCVGVTVQRGKQVERKGEEYVCPSCLKDKGKKKKLGGESGYESSKTKSGVNLKGYAHGKKDSKRKGEEEGSLKRRKSQDENPKKAKKSASSDSANFRKCIVSNCNNHAQADSIYCSNVCILRHAKESLGEITKTKQQNPRSLSTDERRETKEERIMRKIKEASSKGKVAVFCRKTGKIFSNASAPLKEDLNLFLKRNPTYQPLKPPKKKRENVDVRERSADEAHNKKPHNNKQTGPYDRDPEYKPEEPHPSNPYKPTYTPSSDLHKAKKHKLEKHDSHEYKKLKHKKSTETERRHSTEKAQKVTPHKRDSRSLSDEKVESKKDLTPQKEKDIRKNVQKTLLGILQNRSKNSEDLKMHPDSVTRLANKIEDSLFKLFGGVTSKYKNRYRSIMFNLKDEKNQGLWRKVILGEVTSSSLVKMTPEEMASKELAQWRKHELTAELEMIHELEIAKQNIRPVAKITHKGEIVINEDFSDLTETHLDQAQEKGGPSIAPQRIRRISANQPDISLELPNITTDTTSEHNSHLFDLNCRICTGQVKEEDVILDDSSQKKVKRSTSIILSNEAQSTEMEMEQTEEEILKKISDFNKSQEVFPLHEPAHKRETSEEEEKEGTSMPESPQDDFITETEKNDTKHSTSSEEANEKDPKKDLPAIMSAKLSREHFLWTGMVSMPELSSFRTNAYTVSGNARELIHSIPSKLVLDGRIHPKVVWEYLAKVSTFSNKEICVVQFRASSEDDRVGYVSMLSYFSSRRRFGVVSNQNTQVIKDIYIVPLLESENVPEQLLPFRGPGIPNNHPSMLLGVIVRCIPDPPSRKTSTDSEPVKKDEKPRKHPEKQKAEGGPDQLTLKTSLLDRNKLLAPPMAHFLSNSPKNNEEEEEYNPETANFGNIEDVDLPQESPKQEPAEDDEAYDPEKLVFDDAPVEDEDDAPYDPEDDAERLESTELKALQEKQALLEKMKRDIEMQKAELAKEEMSLQIQVPPPPPKPPAKTRVDPRIAKRMNNGNSLPTNVEPQPPEESPLQKIFSVLNFDRSKTT